MSENELVSIIMGDEQTEASLLDIAGVDLSQIEEYRGGERAPEGVYEWKVVEAKLDTMEVNDSKLGAKVRRAAIVFTMEAIACRHCKDSQIDPATLAGTRHQERFFIKDALKDIGRVKAFMTDIGMNATGTLQELLDRTVGVEFVAPIKHTKDKNDASRVYSNLDHQAISPLGGDAQAAVAATAPAVAPRAGFALRR